MLISAQLRFTYRLLPRSFRWLTAYVDYERRLGVHYSWLDNLLAETSKRVANFSLSKIMPPKNAAGFDALSTPAAASSG